MRAAGPARPVLGIIACNRQVGVETAQAVMNRYVRAAIIHADAAALIVPSLPGVMRASEVATRLDGILLTGTPSNIAPARYGDTCDTGDGRDDGHGGDEGPFDADRDDMAFAMVEAMIGQGKPVFGICRGFQELNVALGGTLRRDTATSAGLLAHHAADDAPFDAWFAHTHDVALAPGGTLAAAFGSVHTQVNSVHYQGIATLAPDVTTEATAPDGLIEAFSAMRSGAQILGVQWHPEWDADTNPDSRAYFGLLGKALRRAAK